MLDCPKYGSSLGFPILAVVLSLCAPLPARSQEKPVAPEVARAGACMVDVLRTVPGFVGAKITNLGYGDRKILVSYEVRVPSGQVFHRRAEVYEDGPSRFSIYMTEGLTSALFDGWRSCGVTAVQPIP